MNKFIKVVLIILCIYPMAGMAQDILVISGSTYCEGTVQYGDGFAKFKCTSGHVLDITNCYTSGTCVVGRQ